MVTPEISVIVPTYNRAPILGRTLRALCEGQVGDLPGWEVIVVNDGSTDETASLLDTLQDRYGGRFLALHQGNRKQGAARNTGMARAKGSLFVFLGDDILPDPKFLASHWLRYEASGRSRRYAAIGRTFWHPEIKQTPFREWINEWGSQFGFRLIEDPENVPFNFFYTSNLAFSRDLYADFGGFNESFREYGWEDIELGYRYAQRGAMRLRFVPTAIAYHDHNLSLTAFCRRQFRVGYSALLFHKLYPELRNFLGIGKCAAKPTIPSPLLELTAKILEYVDERIGLDVNMITRFILHQYYCLGLLAARKSIDIQTKETMEGSSSVLNPH